MPTIRYSNGAHIGIRGGKIKLHTEIYHQQTDGSSPKVSNALNEEQYQQACALSRQLDGKYGNGVFGFAEEHKDAVLTFAASIWGQPADGTTQPETETQPDPVTEAQQAADEARAAKQRYEEARDNLMDKLDAARRLSGISANACVEIAAGALSRPTVLKRIRTSKNDVWSVRLTIAKTGVIQTARVTVPRGTSQTEIYARAVAQMADLYAATGEAVPELLPLSETPTTWLGEATD